MGVNQETSEQRGSYGFLYRFIFLRAEGEGCLQQLVGTGGSLDL